MKTAQSTSKYVVGAFVIIALLVFTGTLVHAVFYDPDTEIYLPPLSYQDAAGVPVEDSSLVPASASSSPAAILPAAVPVPGDYPVRLVIPSLSINANVQYVGITAANAMGTPNNFTDAAWYKYGTVPGDVGSAVIDGHVDNGLALAGVFKHLVDIETGADIYVLDKDGTRLHFIVTSVDLYDYHNVPTNQIFNEADGRILRLITCDGTWVPGGRTYDKRLVVSAILDTSD